MTQRYIDLAFDDTSPRSFGGFDNENEATVIRLKVLDPDAKYYIEIEQACGKHDKYCSDVLPVADGYAVFEVPRDFTHETLYVQGVMKVDGMCRKTARVRVGFSHSINALDELPESHPSWAENIENQLGNLADLTTEDKSSLVAAINEAAKSGGGKDAVTYTPQTLTEKQKSQARTNIGAYTKPASGIPKSDLAEDVQTSLAKADTAISLGLTAATPGQIIKVKAVQDGKPTEWEAVDMQGGEEWEKIKEIIIAEGAEESNALTINADENGNAFRLKKARLCAKFPKYTGTSNIPNYSFAMINGVTAGRVSPLLYTSVWPKISTESITGAVYYVDVSGAQQIEHVQVNGNAGWSDDTSRDYLIYGSGSDRLKTVYGDTLWAKPITSIGGAGMLIYPGCHFVLYGVRE